MRSTYGPTADRCGACPSPAEHWAHPKTERYTRPVQVGPYEILEEVARGGIGVLYKARDAEGRVVALKVLQVEGEATKRRFAREVRSMAQLTHANVARLYFDPGVDCDGIETLNTLYDAGLLAVVERNRYAVVVAVQTVLGQGAETWLEHVG